MKPADLNPDATSLEEAFFAKENARALEELRRKVSAEERRKLLREVVQVQDEAFLDRLITLDIGPETVLALRLIPLVFVAWADGHMDDRERKAILEAAHERGVTTESTSRHLLESWLVEKPDPKLLPLWKDYVGRIWGRFTADEQWQMRQNLLQTAYEVAEAAGGFLGLTSKISAEERAVLDDLEKSFS